MVILLIATKRQVITVLYTKPLNCLHYKSKLITTLRTPVCRCRHAVGPKGDGASPSRTCGEEEGREGRGAFALTPEIKIFSSFSLRGRKEGLLFTRSAPCFPFVCFHIPRWTNEKPESAGPCSSVFDVLFCSLEETCAGPRFKRVPFSLLTVISSSLGANEAFVLENYYSCWFYHRYTIVCAASLCLSYYLSSFYIVDE